MKAAIEIHANLPELMEGVKRDIGDVAWQIAAGVESEAKRLIQQSIPTGRTYRRGAIHKPATASLLAMGLRLSQRRQGQIVTGYRFHRASAPGQPPATDTSNLVNSMRARRTGEMSAELAINAGYAGFLEPPFPGETGAQGGLQNRPFVAPAIDFVLEHVVPNL